MARPDSTPERVPSAAILDGEIRRDGRATRLIRRLYDRLVVAQVSDPLLRQRIKLLWFAWGYIGLIRLRKLPFLFRLRLLTGSLKVDWNVLHGHSPGEMVQVFSGIAERRAKAGEAVVEAGCWRGGSSVKFSLLCAHLGYELHIYDSFEGVGDLTDEDRAKEWDYEGQYSSPESTLRENLRLYGVSDVCHIHKGWFSQTLAAGQCPSQVRAVYIDCDIAKGTRDALRGVSGHLTPDAVVFTQDFHIEPIRRLLLDGETWPAVELGTPRLRSLGRRLAILRFGMGKRTD